MSVYSMTGFASATAQGGEGRSAAGCAESERTGSATVELRSVNSRFLDLSFKIPDEFRALEPALREVLGQGLRRGKVELRLTVDRGADAAASGVRDEQLQLLASLEAQVRQRLPESPRLTVFEVLQWCRASAPAPKLDEAVVDATRVCVERLREARAREGARLVAVLLDRVNQLRHWAAQAAPLVPEVVARQQQRFLDRWNEALSSAGAGGAVPVPAQTQAERALNEAAAFAIRIDVAEELARLGAHLDEIERLLKAGGEVGKRLDFLIQELHREANTLGSKSAVLELSRISVEMKVLIEQLREQVQNLE